MWMINFSIFIGLWWLIGNFALALFWSLFAAYFIYILRWMLNKSVFSMVLMILGVSWLFGEDDDV